MIKCSTNPKVILEIFGNLCIEICDKKWFLVQNCKW